MTTSMPRFMFLGVALAALLAACGSDSKGQATTPVTSSTEPTEPTEPTGTQPADPVPTEPVAPPEPPAPTYLHGKLVWYELESSDPARSKAFFAELLGWTIEPQETAGVKYELAKAGGKEVATIRSAEGKKKIKSRWIPYVSVPDVDAAVSAVEQSKGKVVKAAQDVPDIGRYAVVSDPNGAVFAVFKNARSDDPDTDQAKQGEFVWAENMTRNKKSQATALAFYPAAVGYTASSMDVTEGKKKSKYDMLSFGDKHRAGVVAAKPANLAGQWLPWVSVDDVDGTIAKVKGLKGKVAVKPHDIPGVGRAALVIDPTGAPLGLLKSLSPEEQKAAMEKAAAAKTAAEEKKAAGDKKKEEKKKAPDPKSAQPKP